MKNSKISKAKESPTKVFESPADVVVADMPAEQKAEILENWENEAHQLQAAADESMIGGEPSKTRRGAAGHRQAEEGRFSKAGTMTSASR